jgi:hypothetical protein
MIRGRAQEIVPEDHVLLIKESGESLRISWAEIDRVTLGWDRSAPPPANSTTPRPGADGVFVVPPPTDSPPPMSGPLARVHVDAPRHVSLYRKPPGAENWYLACSSPCDVRLPLDDDYRVQGTDVKRSDTFKLHAINGEAVVRADPSSLTGSIFGGILATVGGITALVGLVAVPEKKSRTGGAIALAIGSALVVGGFLIYRASAKTDISLVTAPEPGADTNKPKKSSKAPTPTTMRLDAFVREPEWRGAAAGSGSTGIDPSTERALTVVPTLFSRSF